MKYSFVATSDSIIVTIPGKPVVTIQKSAPNYLGLLNALKAYKENPNSVTESGVEEHLDVASSIKSWAKGQLTLQGNNVLYKGDKVPTQLAERMFSMAARGDNPLPLMNFWEKLQKNPSWRSVEQLWGFLNRQDGGHPILPNGNFLAYKGVKTNYTDQHSGTVDNKPGVTNEMPRNKISDDPSQTCHYGFHVGSLQYARGFAAIVVVCEIDPSDVVCVPNDYDAQKMRVCKYRVRGNHNGELLPSTVYELEQDIGHGSKIEEEQGEVAIVDSTVNAKELELAVKVGKISAIKAYRDRTKKGLKESKDAIEHAMEVLKLSEKDAKVRGEKVKVERAVDKAAKITKIPRTFQKIHEMRMSQLMHEEIGKLRSYASQVLHIVGASKIPGGKTTLVAQIIKVRRNFR